jgi:ACS family allantoate permease-like MFS transporter
MAQPQQTVAPSHDPEKANDNVLPGTDLSESAIKSGHIVPEQIFKHSHDADAALKAFANYHGRIIEIDDVTNRRLLRKIDWNLMPV